MQNPDMGDLRFIETQLPVSKLSKESYKERKANYSQTLTGLGKWWGRKPLIMVRAAILGLLLPASNNPKRDREIFLKILTMDDEGLWQRKTKAIALKDLFERLTPAERMRWFDEECYGRRHSVAKQPVRNCSAKNAAPLPSGGERRAVLRTRCGPSCDSCGPR
jgi:hypothetical protein